MQVRVEAKNATIEIVNKRLEYMREIEIRCFETKLIVKSKRLDYMKVRVADKASQDQVSYD